jgi:hypothetical protein
MAKTSDPTIVMFSEFLGYKSGVLVEAEVYVHQLETKFKC